MKKFEYKFVKATEGMSGISLGSKKLEENYKAIIEQHAQEGWRLVQLMATSISGPSEIIFEREVQ